MDNIPEIHLLKQLPETDELLESPSLKYYIEAYSRKRVMKLPALPGISCNLVLKTFRDSFNRLLQ